jgi:hypothetical protein
MRLLPGNVVTRAMALMPAAYPTSPALLHAPEDNPCCPEDGSDEKRRDEGFGEVAVDWIAAGAGSWEGPRRQLPDKGLDD